MQKRETYSLNSGSQFRRPRSIGQNFLSYSLFILAFSIATIGSVVLLSKTSRDPLSEFVASNQNGLGVGINGYQSN